MNRGIRITFNAPVVITFALICLIATSLGEITKGETTLMLFATSRTSLLSPLTYVRFISYVFGHADWAHYIGNVGRKILFSRNCNSDNYNCACYKYCELCVLS